eukprot:CAMPEP_0183718340 /NCGR_PEP_ID=MMETSP0737-20130205/11625_1 /TAXON_ID=385413 /ORGANISM="Thalassiosira miniscula, Strain CCMP1093" /LENGTH=517 /DNA_ID=CAMNT_0025947885 /DNA_START=427 /DNA_END=1980 /DNA_ORIENTATION=+
MSERRMYDKSSPMMKSMAGHINCDIAEFSENYDETAPPVGLDMDGHDTFLMGPKAVMLDSFIVDLLNVDTSAQTFRLKLLLNMDWEDDGTIEPETKAKRVLTKHSTFAETSTASFGSFNRGSNGGDHSRSFNGGVSKSFNGGAQTGVYKTGKYVLKPHFQDDAQASTWNPEVVLVNAIADEDPIEAGSKFHSVKMLAGRPVISRTVLYQPECRCKFTFSNFPFDETDLVVKFGSNKWNSEQVNFIWSDRLLSMTRRNSTKRGTMRGKLKRKDSKLFKSVDENAIGGVGLSEFEIIKVRVETDEKDVNSMQRYDNAQGAFSQAHLIIRVRRDPFSYLLRVATVAELLMFLEVLSFLTDNSDLSARFSISGTIFLAMVSLYGPMADNLPKVSVVTRVDKWHLQNFFLLFVSNVENLMAFMFRGVINRRFMENFESVLGILYLFFVIKNFNWFVAPLKEREEYELLLDWLEDTSDWLKEKFLPWRNKNKGRKSVAAKNWGTAATEVRGAVRFKNSVIKHD